MKKILIVEDEQDIRESLKDLLEMNGFSVSTAANGAEAIFAATADKPDLILSDFMMPGINGMELLKMIQNKSDLSDVPFVFLSAKSDQSSIRNGMNLGADDYLSKPVKKDELLTVINKRLQKAFAAKKQLETDYLNLINRLNESAQHEFNTPMNAILGFSQLLKKSPDISTDKIINFANLIEISGKRLKNVLENTLLYRAAMINNLDPVKENFIVSTYFITQIASEIAETYDRNDDLIIHKFTDFKVSGSISDLKKIIRELIDNALKFSEKGEVVIVEVFPEYGKNIIKIRDFGRGMSHEQISCIDAFVQFNRSKYEQQGMGLGLFLCRELATANHWNFQIFEAEKGLESLITI